MAEPLGKVWGTFGAGNLFNGGVLCLRLRGNHEIRDL
jgi:sugar/nucleoside kinase (ribokinase family)